MSSPNAFPYRETPSDEHPYVPLLCAFLNRKPDHIDWDALLEAEDLSIILDAKSGITWAFALGMFLNFLELASILVTRSNNKTIALSSVSPLPVISVFFLVYAIVAFYREKRMLRKPETRFRENGLCVRLIVLHLERQLRRVQLALCEKGLVPNSSTKTACYDTILDLLERPRWKTALREYATHWETGMAPVYVVGIAIAFTQFVFAIKAFEAALSKTPIAPIEGHTEQFEPALDRLHEHASHCQRFE